MRQSYRLGVIIAAAGKSRRMGNRDKLFLPLGGKPLLCWAVDTCQKSPLVSQIVLVLKEADLDRGRKLVIERNWTKVTSVCSGGERRQDSVKRGLKELKDCAWVMIHDGARPFLTLSLIEAGLRAAMETGAAVAAVPAKDTIKIATPEGIIKETLNRSQLWIVQTPQIFRYNIIVSAYSQVGEEVTDDATLVEKLGYKVKLYMGDYNNIKITTPEDLLLAEIIAKTCYWECVSESVTMPIP